MEIPWTWLLSSAAISILASIILCAKPSPLEFEVGRRKARQSHAQDDRYYAKRGVKSSEEFVKNSRGIEIFTKQWLPAKGEIKGLVFYCHGYGDTCAYFFDDVAVRLATRQYAVASMDYEGHGQSSGRHVYIKDFDNIVGDVVEQADRVKSRVEFLGLPCFLYGESMGGAVALQVHRRQTEAWDGAILLAPMCKIADNMIPPAIVVATLKFMAKVVPRWKAVPTKDICEIAFRVPEKQKKGRLNPTTYSGKPRLGTAVSLLNVTDTIGAHLHEVGLDSGDSMGAGVSTPLLILHGAADIVTDPSVSRALYKEAMSTDKTIHLYPDAWHALTAGEPDEIVDQVMSDILTWLDKRSKPISTGGGDIPRDGALKA